MRGAEAVLKKGSLIGHPTVVKERMKKNYRVDELDSKLRKERTRAEARLLHKAKLAGVRCPTVLEISDFSITMNLLRGDHPKMSKGECGEAGRMLALLHSAGIIHGDFTPVNLMKEKGKLYVIDFGLGFFSNDIEDKAVDVFTMVKALDKRKGEAFLIGYRHKNPKYESVVKRLKEVEKRVRYAV